ncbi:MAG: hypothetical protein J2P50_01585 [Hyphomicrobiaceae bacterium]|nr:hypothetical protein [Hyphomicrobiaceae bacterium]
MSAVTTQAKGTEEAGLHAFPMQEFLDRLMTAESAGHLRRKNPRSTALGPFQFIEPTFLLVVNKSFRSQVAGLSERQILALRTNLAFSRQAAAAYAHDLISALKDSGLQATQVNVRLAFLVGPSAAVRLLKTPPDQPLEKVLSADAIAANPSMSGATVGELVQKAAADVRAIEAAPHAAPQTARQAATADQPAATWNPDGSPVGEPAEIAALTSEPITAAVASNIQPPATLVALQDEPPGAPIEIKCDVSLASCRKWIELRARKAQLLAGSAQP